MATPGTPEDMALFVVHIGLTPADYYALTISERNAILREWNRAQKARK